jgi:hypothetical protein
MTAFGNVRMQSTFPVCFLSLLLLASILCAELAFSLWCWHSFTVRPISGVVEASAGPAAVGWVGQVDPQTRRILNIVGSLGLLCVLLTEGSTVLLIFVTMSGGTFVNN